MRVLYITLFVVVTDQLSKFWIKGFHIPFLNIKHEGMQIGQKIPVIDDFFRITFIENPGLAFGIDINSDIKLWISIFSLFASVALIIYIYVVRFENLGFRIALALILGGAFGNFIDRAFYGVIYGYAPLFYGKVVDFLDFDFFNLTFFGRSYDRFAIFNLADSAVTIGIFLLIISHRSHAKEKHKDEITQTARTIELNDTNENSAASNISENSEFDKLNDKADSREETPL